MEIESEYGPAFTIMTANLSPGEQIKVEPQILEPLEVHPRTSLTVVEQLRHNHYVKKPLDDAISSDVFDNYLEALDPGRAYFMAADKVKWRKPVKPGDILVIDVELTKCRGKIGKAKGECLVQGEVVSEAEVTFVLTDASTSKS